MKHTPLLMIENMVSKTLEDIKTQTRRVVKSHPEYVQVLRDGRIETSKDGGFDHDVKYITCPYGTPGDRLWIKETHYRYGKWIKNGLSKTGRQRWTFKALSNEIRYFDRKPDMLDLATGRGQGWHKRPSIFMPKWASRLTLEIVSIRVERLQDISEKDIADEGVDINYLQYSDYNFSYGENIAYANFRYLWDSINAERDGGAYAWITNPWIWVITFRRIENEMS